MTDGRRARTRRGPGVRVDLVAGAVQYLDHLAPVWHALPDRARGRFVVPDPPAAGSVDDLVARAAGLGITSEVGLDGPDRPTLVASAGDLRRVRDAGRSHVALIEHGIGQCLDPETRVLTADLRYVPVGTLQVGDRLVAFEEEATEGQGRRWRSAVVTATRVIKRQSYRLWLADGTSIVASEGHRWLTRDRRMFEWTLTENLQDAARWPTRSSKLIRCFDTWEEDRTWGGAYLAAAFDGEGYLTQTRREGRQNHLTVGFSQKPNGMLDQVTEELAVRRFRFSVSEPDPTSGVVHLAVLGGTREIMRFLGSLRPRRLMAKLRPLDNGQMRGRPVELVHLEPIGEQDVVALETSTRTLIAEGFASHNSYAGDRDWAHRSSYPGGRGRDAELFLHPNATSAARDRATYPEARIEVVGCPKLDSLPAREPGPGPVVAVAFHWDGAMPELRWAWPRFRHAIVRLAARYTVIGHGHPRAMADLAPWYRRAGIEVVPDFADVCRRADLLVFDNSSVGFEFASTGRPVVVLDPYHYRRGVHHGLRFWDAIPGLVCADRAGVPDAVSLTAVVERALEDPPEAREARERALELVYAHRSGAAERAAKMLVDWARGVATEDDAVAPVGAPVGPRGADSDEVASVPASETADPVGATP